VDIFHHRGKKRKERKRKKRIIMKSNHWMLHKGEGKINVTNGN